MRAYNKQDLPKGCKSRTQTENSLITFGLAIELLARTNKNFMKRDGAPNKLQIARHLEKEATKSVASERVTGQSSRAIRGRLNEALKMKNENS